MSVARGKYLAFLDSDDFFEPEMLKYAYEKCELMDADVAIYRFRKYNTETSLFSEYSYGISDVVVPTEDPFSVFNLQRNINKIADGNYVGNFSYTINTEGNVSVNFDCGKNYDSDLFAYGNLLVDQVVSQLK